MAQARITITANLFDIIGDPLAAAKLRVQLCAYGPQIPMVPGTAVLASCSPIEIVASTTPSGGAAGAGGEASFTLWGNDVIVPANTYYTITALDSNNNVVQTNAYQFSGTSPVDLSTAPLFNPNPPFPVPVAPVLPEGPQFVRLAYGATPTFAMPNAGIVTFGMMLTGRVSSSTIGPLSAGQIVGFYLQQDATGGHTFTYPPNVKNASAIVTSPGASNFQAFVMKDDNNLYAVGPGTYI